MPKGHMCIVLQSIGLYKVPNNKMQLNKFHLGLLLIYHINKRRIYKMQ